MPMLWFRSGDIPSDLVPGEEIYLPGSGMNRRGFLKAILAAGVAPAFVGSGVLMPVRSLWLPNDVVLDADEFAAAYNMGVAEELQSVMRRAFVPRMIVQLYKNSPTLSGLVALQDAKVDFQPVDWGRA